MPEGRKCLTFWMLGFLTSLIYFSRLGLKIFPSHVMLPGTALSYLGSLYVRKQSGFLNEPCHLMCSPPLTTFTSMAFLGRTITVANGTRSDSSPARILEASTKRHYSHGLILFCSQRLWCFLKTVDWKLLKNIYIKNIVCNQIMSQFC